MMEWKPPKELLWVDEPLLLLDPDNPRVISEKRLDQPGLLHYMYQHEALEELADSMARNGYFVEEPLVSIPGPDKTHIVVEGNRRLATLRLLLYPALQNEVGASGWPVPSAASRTSLSKPPVVQYDRRDDVLAFIGFRHITGIKKWEYFARSRYVKQLVDSGKTLPDIEDLLGDQHAESRRLYQAAVTFDQIRSNPDLDFNAVRENASLIEVVLSSQPLKGYLGVEKRLPTEKVEAVVPVQNEPQLEEVVNWVFGNNRKGLKPVIAESRDIKSKLSQVVESEPAIEHLRDHLDLDGAIERVGGEERFVIRQLQKAIRNVQEANRYLPSYRENEEVKGLVDDLKTYVGRL